MVLTPDVMVGAELHPELSAASTTFARLTSPRRRNLSRIMLASLERVSRRMRIDEGVRIRDVSVLPPSRRADYVLKVLQRIVQLI